MNEPFAMTPPKPPQPAFFSIHGNTAQIVSAAVAAVALVFVAYQVWSIRANARIATARQVYMCYSESLLKYPDLSEPNLPKLRTDPVEWVRYKNFVAHMLFAYASMTSRSGGSALPKR